MYGFICFLLMGSGVLIGFLINFDYMAHPGKAIAAGLLICLGLFLWSFRGKSVDSVRRGVDAVNDTGRWWMWWGN